MKTSIVASGLVLALAAGASAGEIIFKNGSRLAGELGGESLLVSTKAGALEVNPDDVLMLTAAKVRLKDGRVVQGTVVGQAIKAKTSLGELAIKLDELASFRADPAPAAKPGGPGPQAPVASSASTPTQDAGTPAALVPATGQAAAEVAASSPESEPSGTGPTQVISGAKAIGHGFESTAKGVGQTVVDAADAAHDGIKGFGLKVWDVMKGVGQVFQNAFGS